MKEGLLDHTMNPFAKAPSSHKHSHNHNHSKTKYFSTGSSCNHHKYSNSGNSSVVDSYDLIGSSNSPSTVSTPSIATYRSPGTGSSSHSSSSHSSSNHYISLMVEEAKHQIPIKSIGCPRESADSECRVAVTAETVQQLVRKGYSVLVERDAGVRANIPDGQYVAAGAAVVGREEAFKADAVLKVQIPNESEISLMKKRAVLISFIYPALNKALVDKLAEGEITVIAMDCIPRITRAQTFDALSSMANIAGYKAVVEAAHHFGRFLSGQMTAAGHIPPAKVLVIGGGVAGLSAIATARNLGAVVRCFDTRPAVKEQVESLGGEFLDVSADVKLEEGSGGYAKEMTKEFIEAEMKLFAEQCKEVDIVITTALIPGKPAPRLITKEMIDTMKYGSVVVDLAAEMGGNIETIRKDEVYVSENGITHIGLTNLPSKLPAQASKLYSNNIYKLLASMTGKHDCSLLIDLADDITRSAIVSFNGKLLWPPPPLKVSLPAPQSTTSVGPAAEVAKKAEAASSLRSTISTALIISLIFLVLLGVNFMTNNESIISMLVTFVLAGVIGYQVVWNVAPALHTPLMSVTNAISGITAIGGILLLNNQTATSDLITRVLAGVALVSSCINISGGFVITKRMLDMFKRPNDEREYNIIYCIPAFFLVAVYFAAVHFKFAGVERVAYLACSLCCILGIGGLATQKTSRFGNAMGMVGVFSGVTVAFVSSSLSASQVLKALIFVKVGLVVGLGIGKMVGVTDLPQTVAAFHSFVGLAAMVTSIAHFTSHSEGMPAVLLSAILGDFIGGLTLTGSIVAFCKLHGLMKSKALDLPGKNYANGLMMLLFVGSVAKFMLPASPLMKLYILIFTALLSMALGFHLVASVGGGDMPVCITVLNSYSGWALVAEGFMFQNTMMTIVGSLIGFSGGILSYIMCRAMNRSLTNVLFGGYATLAGSSSNSSSSATAEDRIFRETTPDETVEMIANCHNMIIVPGYGMAVAKAQHGIAELSRLCRDRKIRVRFAIHPVAGRMPGQMNVLLAEAGVPYDWVFEMEQINEEFLETDVVLVIGANDITNSAAEEVPDCPIAGMPVLQVWKAKHCVFMKRSMGSGYADLENPVFFKSKTSMLLGDAKFTVEELVSKLRAYWEP